MIEIPRSPSGFFRIALLQLRGSQDLFGLHKSEVCSGNVTPPP